MGWTAEQSRAWRAANPGRAAAHTRRWESQQADPNAHQKAHLRRRATTRKEQVDAIKTASGCTDCGWNDPDLPEALEFDHKDQATKSFSIGSNVNRHTWAEVLAEIAKCEVVCAICHRRRSKFRNVYVFRR